MFYISPTGNTILEAASCFLYEEEVSLIYKDRVELYSSRYLRKKNPISQKYIHKLIPKKDCTVSITVEWIGAPMEFFKMANFKPLDSEDYKNSIKETRKLRKNGNNI